MIEAVLFDIDGTLLDHDGASEGSLCDALEREGAALSGGHRWRAIEEWRRLEELHYAEYLSGACDLAEQRRRRAAGILRWLGAARSGPEQLDAWFADYLRGYRERCALFDDVEPALAALERRGLALGVITNADAELQRAKLAAVGIEQRLPTFVASSAVGVAKPAAAIFAAGCEALGLGPERVAYVGDRLDTDARGARDAGLLGVWLARDASPAPDGVATISGLEQLERLI